jgi:hypothetical protein
MKGRYIPFTAAVTIFVPLAFSDEFLNAIVDALGREYDDYRWLLAIIDAVILALLGWQGVRFQRARGGLGRTTVLWWSAGAVVTLVADRLENVDPLGTLAWFDVATSVVYVVTLAVLFAATLGADPLLLVSPGRRSSYGPDNDDWRRVRATVPLLVGVLGAYLASAWWIHFLHSHGGVNSEFFSQVSQVIALLIVALGIEEHFYGDAMSDSMHRPLAILSLSVLALGEVLALSVLVRGDTKAKNGVNLIGSWHGYVALILSVYACLVALTTLIWVLAIRPARRRRS